MEYTHTQSIDITHRQTPTRMRDPTHAASRKNRLPTSPQKTPSPTSLLFVISLKLHCCLILGAYTRKNVHTRMYTTIILLSPCSANRER